MSLALEDVEYLAQLARLDLKPEEKQVFQQQLSAILEYFHRLQEVDTEQTEPTSSVLPLAAVLRQDQPAPSLTLEQLLSNAPDSEGYQFRLPPVFE